MALTFTRLLARSVSSLAIGAHDSVADAKTATEPPYTAAEISGGRIYVGNDSTVVELARGQVTLRPGSEKLAQFQLDAVAASGVACSVEGYFCWDRSERIFTAVVIVDGKQRVFEAPCGYADGDSSLEVNEYRAGDLALGLVVTW